MNVLRTEDGDGMETDTLAADGSDVGEVLTLPSTAVLRAELARAVAELSFCEMASSTQWAAELCAALPPSESSESAAEPLPCSRFGSAKVHLAKAHFNMREYSRAAHVLQGIKDLHKNQHALFLKFYALYLAGEKRKEEETMETASPADKFQSAGTADKFQAASPTDKLFQVRNMELKAIAEQLHTLHKQKAINGLNLYLYGITLRGLELKTEARAILLECVREFPWNWSAWLDIIAICSDLNDVIDGRHDLDVPDHWMSCFFQAALHVEMQQNQKARNLYVQLQKHFPESSYILSQLAACHYNMRDFDTSQSVFEDVRKKDPYKLVSMDTYSNILYVKEQAARLSSLVRVVIKIDRYTPEACCTIGNYYSLKHQHEKSVTYFQKALGLNRSFTPAWILMGHEFMEMKNNHAAIEAYRMAVNINRRDYRAWYGLGQTYESLKQHQYALCYYKQAKALRPTDARMWYAMAQCFDTLDRKTDAIMCFEKAYSCHDNEASLALPRLAKLYEEKDIHQAAYYHTQVISLSMDNGGGGPGNPLREALTPDKVAALNYLMNYHDRMGDRVQCRHYALQLEEAVGPERDEAEKVLKRLHRLNMQSHTSSECSFSDPEGWWRIE